MRVQSEIPDLQWYAQSIHVDLYMHENIYIYECVRVCVCVHACLLCMYDIAIRLTSFD